MLIKKVLVLIVLSFLAACGGGGEAGNSVTDVTSETQTGILSVNFTDGSSTAKTVAELLPHSHMRVVITNPTLRVNGAPFKVLQDQPAGGTFSFALPLASGYIVEAVTYSFDSQNLKVPADYAIKKFVSIVSSTSNTVTLNLYPTEATLVVPGSVTQGGKFAVMANLSTAGGRSATPLQSAWYLLTPQTTPYATFQNRTSVFVYSATHPVTAPIIGQGGTKLYYQGAFTLKTNLLAPNETSKQWVFNAPGVTFGNVSTTILAPTNVSFPAP